MIVVVYICNKIVVEYTLCIHNTCTYSIHMYYIIYISFGCVVCVCKHVCYVTYLGKVPTFYNY